MSINIVSYSNTFSDWITTTNSLVSRVNEFDSGDFAKTTGTLNVAVPAVYTSTLDISGRTTISGNVSYTSGLVTFSNTSNLVCSVNSFFSGELNSNNVIKVKDIYANGNIWISNTSSLFITNTSLVFVSSNGAIANLNANYLGGYDSNVYINYTNTATIQAQSAFIQANTGTVQAQSAFFRANTGVTQAQAAFVQANTGTIQAQSAFFQANTGVTQAQAAFVQANTGTIQAQSAFFQANTNKLAISTIFPQSNSVTIQSQAAFSQANNAYFTANTKLNSSGGTVTGLIKTSLTNSTNLTTGSHIQLENPTGSQTTIGATFNNVPVSTIRFDSSGNMLLSANSNAYFFNYDLGTGSTFTLRSAAGTWGTVTGITNITFPGTVTATTFSGSGASLTNVPASQLTGSIPNGVLGNSSFYIGTTSITISRASAAQSLTGITSIDGSAAFITGTNIGKTGAQGFMSTASWASTDWANVAIGGCGMTIASTPGAPTANYGYFKKIGNRDSGGGWGGIWMDYSVGDFYYGSTTTSSSNANWYKLAKADGTNASGTWGISVTGNAATAGGLAVASGRNNQANQLVRTDASGYLQTGYINSDSGNEGNNSNPARVWGTNGTDSYLRSYLTSALSVSYAASAGAVAWTNVSSRPTALSSFTNDSGYITSSGRAYPRTSDGTNLNFYWSGAGFLGQPNWLWGGSDGSNMYAYNPSNFNVNFATYSNNLQYSGGNYRMNQDLFTSSNPTFNSVYSTIYYDSNNTGYYMDPQGTSNLLAANLNATWNYYAGNNTAYAGQAGTLVAGGFGSSPSATMSFHRPGAYAVNMGLDTDNVFRIGGWSAGANRIQLDMSGNFTAAGNVTAYSDARLKTNITTIENALEAVSVMRGVKFTRIDTDEDGTGVIAQEMQEIVPEVVLQDNDGNLSVAYGNLVGYLIEAIKELKVEVEQLKNK